ncbi:AcrR family transcriptional regulator [Thermocatellispora tengchongensis]|uniref:AcrR family transcriptional regulator n=1 Tax=Thermocatellispora tengchongensis TaxID=1073253 RepID=A0A840NWS2_9ACTN|nr:TetR/AcrR family transcriptional regulator [Thermocatellispora tengchongensis]MBB5133284.1 AcrR family transcriptional regulator [Thermocatellispora tengchongensis]
MTTLDRGDETRTRILQAACRLFAERGYAATSLADIAAEVGLTKTAVAYHFHPKDRLAAEIIAPAAGEALALVDTDFGADHEALIDALVRFLVRHRAMIRLLMEDISGADIPQPGTNRDAIRAFRDEIELKLAGPDPTEADHLRAWAILGALQYGVAKTMDLPDETVRETLRAAVLALHASRP